MVALHEAFRIVVSRSLPLGAAGAAVVAAQRGNRIAPARLGLQCSIPLPMDSIWGGLLRVGMDPRFLLGLVIGWKVLAELLRGRKGKAADGSAAKDKRVHELAQLQRKLDELQEQLVEARAAAIKAESLWRGAEKHRQRSESARLALEAEVARLERRVAQLQPALAAAAQRQESDGRALAAENARLLGENQVALAQLRALAAAVQERQGGAAEEAGGSGQGGAEFAELEGENEQLRHALSEVRCQLSGVMSENAELADRLLRVAFEPVGSPDMDLGGTPTASPLRRNRALCADEGIQRAASAAQQKLHMLAEVVSGRLADSGGGSQGGAGPSAFAAALAAEGAGEGAASGAVENDSSAHNGISPVTSVKGGSTPRSVASSDAS